MKSFLQGKKAHAEPPLRAPAGISALAHVGHAAAAPGDAHSPHVEVVKEGDKVVRIVVTCSCGEKIEVDCIYSGRS